MLDKIEGMAREVEICQCTLQKRVIIFYVQIIVDARWVDTNKASLIDLILTNIKFVSIIKVLVEMNISDHFVLYLKNREELEILLWLHI